MSGFELTLSSNGLAAYCLRLSETLLHFLWQGSLIALLAWAAAGWFRRRSADTRYVANTVALGLMATCLPITFALTPMRGIDSPDTGVARQAAETCSKRASAATLANGVAPDTLAEETAGERSTVPFPAVQLGENAAETDPLTGNESTLFSAGKTRASNSGGPIGEYVGQKRASHQTYAARFQPWAKCLVAVYLLGVIAMMFRVVRDLWGGQCLRRDSTALDEPALLETIRAEALRIGLKAAPTVGLCRRVAVPAVVGVLRPMILLPPSAITGLSTEELEALLIHELAHIRRYDLLVSLLQRLTEAVLFFHPAVWYVSRRINVERERCCDDLVLSSGFPRLRYADALVRMAELCAGGPVASNSALVAGAGKDATELKQRVLRLLEPSGHDAPRLRLTRSGVICLVASWMAIMLAPAAVESWTEDRNRLKASQPKESSLDREALLALAQRDRFEDGTIVTLEPIHGKITGRGGRPVVGAKVYLREHPRSWQSWGRNTPTKTRDLAVTTSDAQGKYRFENVRSQPLHILRQDVLPVDVIVVAEGYAVAWQRLSEYGASNFQLKLASKVHGRIVDEKQKPATGTTVRVLRFAPLTEIANMNLARRDYPRTVGNMLDLACAGFQIAATADGQGRFTLSGLPKSSGVILEVNDPRYYREVIYTTANPDHPVWRESARVSKPAPSSYVVPSPYARSRAVAGETKRRARFGLRESVQISPIEIALHRGIRLKIRVVDDETGEPIQGARLPEAPVFTYPARGLTDESGIYGYSQLQPGFLSPRVAPPEGSKWIGTGSEIELAENVYDASAEVRLSRGAIISGRVVDESTGRGIANVRLYHTVQKGHGSSTRTDQQGRFRIVGHPGEGQVVLYSAVPGYETPVRSGSIHQAPERFKRNVNATLDKPHTDIVFKLVPDVLFHGRTLDPAGKPIAGVKLSGEIPRGGNSYISFEQESDNDGRYALTGFYADVHQKRRPKIPVLFRDEVRGLAVQVVFSPPPRDGAKEIERDIRLQQAGTVTGRVVDDTTNKPIVGAGVSVSHWRGNSGRHSGGTKTDRQGRYSYRGLIPDQEHTVQIRAEGYVVSGGKPPYSGHFTVKAGETRTMPEFHMTPKAVAESTVGIPLAQPPKIDGLSPEKALKLLLARFDKDRAAYRKRFDATTDRNERKKIVARQEPTGAYSQAFMTLADKNRDSDVELKSLIWICKASVKAGADSTDLYRRKEEAARRLLEKYADRKEIVDCLKSLVYRSGKPRETAQLLIDKSPHREVQGRACLLAAEILERDLFMTNSTGGKPSEEARQETIRFYRRVGADYADISDWRHGTIGKQAEQALNVLENLWIGQVAPDIVGKDLEGKPLKLSDYRGRIVVLTFTSDIEWWSLLPRTMAEFEDDEKVVVLGVYAGSDREAARKAAAENGITWRIWFDGPKEPGPIVSAWHNTTWPNTHVLDQKGVIRYRDLDRSRLPSAIEALWPEPEE